MHAAAATAVRSSLMLIVLSSFSVRTNSAFQTDNDFSGAVMDFGLRLQNVLMLNHNGSNIVLSPTSIYGTLALNLLGSDGETYNEFAQILNFTDVKTDDEHRHLLLSEKLRNLNTARNSSQTLFSSGVFVDNSLNIRRKYKEYLVNIYNASVKYCNFQQGAKCQEEINKWISTQTNNHITELLREPLPQNTLIVLTSALYFQGQWLKPFFPEYTQKFKFSPDINDPKKDVEVDAMLNFGQFKYSISTQYGCELLAIPYKDTRTTLYAVKPTFPKRKSINELLTELTALKLTAMMEDASVRNVILRFPKMKAVSRWDLKKSLKFLGLNSAFSSQKANFALMIDAANRTNCQNTSPLSKLFNPKVFIDAVLHEVQIDFNEFGTEAVAATATTMVRSAVTFYLYSPFAFFIIDEDTKLVTFSAVIFDPTK